MSWFSTHVIHVESSEDAVHVVALRSAAVHPEHPLELVQVQGSAGTLDDEGPVQVLDAVQLQLVLLGLRLLTLAHPGISRVTQFPGAKKIYNYFTS